MSSKCVNPNCNCPSFVPGGHCKGACRDLPSGCNSCPGAQPTTAAPTKAAATTAGAGGGGDEKPPQGWNYCSNRGCNCFVPGNMFCTQVDSTAQCAQGHPCAQKRHFPGWNQQKQQASPVTQQQPPPPQQQQQQYQQYQHQNQHQQQHHGHHQQHQQYQQNQHHQPAVSGGQYKKPQYVKGSYDNVGRINKQTMSNSQGTGPCNCCHERPKLHGIFICYECGTLITVEYVKEMKALQGEAVRFFDKGQPFYELVNSFPVDIEHEGKVYRTVEHLFQAWKFLDTAPEVSEEIRQQYKPRDGQKIAHSNSSRQRSDWHQIKEEVMYIALRKKFENPHCKRVLMMTENNPLICHTPWDKEWGNGGDDQGKNLLGKLMMKVRDDIRAEDAQGK